MVISNVNIEDFKSVVSNKAHENTSAKYGFISTTSIIHELEKHGWVVASAKESKTRKENHVGYQRHLVTMRKSEDIRRLTKEEIISELRIDNSHNGGSRAKIMLGLYRCVCSNQMIVSDNVIETHTIKHIGETKDHINQALKSITEQMPKVLNRVDDLKKIDLNKIDYLEYGKEALDILYPNTKKWDKKDKNKSAEKLMRPMRIDDEPMTLWNAFNVVQEKFIGGGEFLVNKKPNKIGIIKTAKKKAVTGINTDIRLNKGLWHLTERFAETLNTGGV